MNDHEMDPLARLRAFDPAAGAPYEHADSAAMLARVTARPRLERVSFARGFRVRMAGAVAAAALVSFGGIAVLESAAPSLSVFALGASSPLPHGSFATDSPNVQSKEPSITGPLIPSNVTFVAGKGLSSLSSRAPSYSLSPAESFGALSQIVAHTLGVHGAPSSTPAANSSWTVGPFSRAFVSFWSDAAELHWEYTNGSAPGVGAISPPASLEKASPEYGDASVLARARSLISGLGISGPFGRATISHSSNGWNQLWITVSIPWTVGGPGSGFTFDVTYTSSGTIVAADGVDVAVMRGPLYPLISPVAGVAVLNGERTGTTEPDPPITAPTVPPGVNPGGPMIPASPTTTINPGGPMIPASTTTVPTTMSPATSSPGSAPGDVGSVNGTPQRASVSLTLRSASLQYAEYGLTNGTDVLLPQWLYVGSNGSQWTVLAVAPTYVRVSPPSNGGIATPDR